MHRLPLNKVQLITKIKHSKIQNVNVKFKCAYSLVQLLVK